MDKLIAAAVRRPVTVLMGLGSLFLGGFFSWSILPLQRLPEFPFPRVTVEALYPGLGAEDIRSSLTIPLEDALSSVKGLERLRSVSRDGSSLTVLDFRWGTDSGAASVQVREAIDAVYPGLPEGVRKPSVVPGDPGEEPQIIAVIRSHLGAAFARNFAEYELRSRLRRVDGVGAVILGGGEKEELELKVDIPRALLRGLPPAALAEILASETANIPAGNSREGERELVVVSRGRPGTEEELGALVFPSESGPFVIGDLGTLNRRPAKRESVFIARDGDGNMDEYVVLEIYRRPGADPVKLSGDVQELVTAEAASFARDGEIRIIYDDGASIVPGIRKLAVSAGAGIIAVMGVLFFTLRSFRYSMLAGLSLPAAIAASLAALAVLGRSLNNMSLSGIALGIGLVSDTSVIILDLLHQSFYGHAERPPRKEVADRAAMVASSSFGGTITTAVVFIPILFLPGPLGSLFGDLSISLVSSIAAGWIYAQFALPSLFRLFWAPGLLPRETLRPGPPLPGLGTARYGSLLRLCMQRPRRIWGAAAVVCITGFGLLISRPRGFLSPADAPEITVSLNFPPGTTMDSIAAKAMDLGKGLAALPGISALFGRAGSEEDDPGKRTDPDYRRETFTYRCILDPGVKPAGVLGEITAALHGTGAAAYIPRDRTEKLLGLSSSATVAVRGRNREELESRAAAAEALLSSGAYIRALEMRPAGSRPELRILPDRAALAYTGISLVETARAVYAASEGVKAGELELAGNILDLKVSALDLPELEALPVALTETGPVFLGSLARVEYREAPAALARLDRSDVLYLDLFPNPGKEGGLSRFLRSLCSEKERGLGRADESAFARYRLSLVLTAALVLILLYLTMGAEFESLSLPLILLLAIPFSLAGAGPALFISGAALDSSSVLALMVLFGLSVNSGMVLYELAHEKHRQGLDPEKAVYEGALERFRPVLTTTLTTTFALVPLAVNPLGAGELSMAAAMLGGLIASTLLTLFALPPVLIRFLKRRSVYG
ncbi:MAG: efflux RND transporter permease subunit [Spirochaetaceae bacterium]|jgi:multidrug efflux pump subunit AcrB|nr:efflux RND transporter permease subunit [Spirochaetaceae bacterium]